MGETLSRRAASRRTTAVAALCAVAVLQVSAVPYALLQGRHIAAVGAAVAAVALRLAFVLATRGTAAAGPAWRVVGALGGAIVAAWVVTRAVAVPGVAEDLGRWTSATGAASAGL